MEDKSLYEKIIELLEQENPKPGEAAAILDAAKIDWIVMNLHENHPDWIIQNMRRGDTTST